MRIKTVKLKLKREHLERLMIGSAAALVLFLAARGAEVPMVEVPYSEAAQEVNTTIGEKIPTQQTTVYYKDGNGYLVPMTMEVPQQEGIARATLGLLTSSLVNDVEASSLGLLTVAPANTTYELDISGGRARVNLSAEALTAADAAQEAAMVDAVVETLTGFDSVDSVEFLVAGQKRGALTHGTPVGGVYTGGRINLESVDASADMTGAETVTLYFPDEGGRLLVPVTRTVWGEADVETAVFELLKGPRQDSGLEPALPGDCALIGVTVRDGAAVINLYKEFEQVLGQSDGGRRALRAMMLTCTRYPGVNRVELQVEGKPYSLEGLDTKPTFVNEAQEVMAWFPGVMEEE